jgi:hypothetical protein
LELYTKDNLAIYLELEERREQEEGVVGGSRRREHK